MSRGQCRERFRQSTPDCWTPISRMGAAHPFSWVIIHRIFPIDIPHLVIHLLGLSIFILCAWNMDLKSLLNTNNRQVQALTPILGSRLPFYTTSDTFSTSSKFDQEEYHNPDEEFDVGDAAENGNNDSNEDPASSEYRRCIWCHKKDIKSRLKRGVTFVVGRYVCT